MGELKDKFFLQYISAGLEKVRDGFREEHTPKKGNRFLIKGLTYEIGTCRKDGAQYVFEISSKIPQEVLPKNVKIEKYFSSVIKLMNKCAKKPSESKMENIIHNTADEELKERDYVKLIYSYDENELCTNEDRQQDETSSGEQHSRSGYPRRCYTWRAHCSGPYKRGYREARKAKRA